MTTLSKAKMRLIKAKQGITPAISTVIMTGAIIVMVLVAMAYGQSYLGSSMAQNEFTTNQQFMLTTGLQIDNVAWTIGRAQTIQYSSTTGDLQLLPDALNYTISLWLTSGAVVSYTLQTGIILYNVPTAEYSLGNNCVEPLSTSSNSSFLQSGTSAPVSLVYAIEKLQMSGGNFARIVVVPTLREMTTTISTQSYTELYLPVLANGTSLGLSQSVTLVCQNINQYLQSGVTRMQLTVAFPLASEGFNSGFFPFQSDTVTQTFTANSYPAVQLYVGEVSVSVGLYG